MTALELVERFWRDGDTPANREKVAGHVVRMKMDPDEVFGLIESHPVGKCPICGGPSMRGAESACFIHA